MYYVFCKCKFRDVWTDDYPPFEDLHAAITIANSLARRGKTEAKVEDDLGHQLHYISFRGCK